MMKNTRYFEHGQRSTEYNRFLLPGVETPDAGLSVTHSLYSEDITFILGLSSKVLTQVKPKWIFGKLSILNCKFGWSSGSLPQDLPTRLPPHMCTSS